MPSEDGDKREGNGASNPDASGSSFSAPPGTHKPTATPPVGSSGGSSDRGGS